MRIPTNLTMRHINKTPAIEQNILEKIDKMGQYFDRIESCKVVVTKQQNKQSKGKLFNVLVQILVPGQRITVNKRSDKNLYVAIRDAFSAMTKKIQSYRGRSNGEAKVHQEIISGYVERLYSNYGFIEAADGVEYYFNSDNVLHHDFNSLKEGSRVRFLEVVPGDSLAAGHVVNGHGTWDEWEQWKKAA